MAIITEKKMQDLDRDIKDIGEANNEDKIIHPRYGLPFKSLPMVSRLFEAMIATGYLTIDDLQAAIDIAAAAGAGANGWTTDLVVQNGITQTTINNRQGTHNKSSATFTDYLTQNEINNSGTTDLSSKLQVVNDENLVGKLRLSQGNYYINGPVVFNRDFSFDFDPDAWLWMGPNGSIKFQGSAELIGKPTSNITNSSRSFGIAHNGKLEPFDLICIYNKTDYSFSPLRANYRAGEFSKVFAVTESTVSLAGKTYADYSAADVDIYKIHPITIDFNRFNVRADNNAVANPVTFTFCEHLDLSKYTNIGSKSAGISIDRCFDVFISEAKATNNSTLVGLNYGISIANSQNIRIEGGANLAARHCVTFGGGDDICSVPCREVFVSKAVLKTGSTASIGAADFHGNVEYCSYINCIIDHASLGGRNNSVMGCTIFGRDLDGCALLLTDLSGGVWNIINCNLIINNNLTATRGALDIVITKDLIEDLVVNISGLRINGKSNSNAYLVKCITASDVVSTKKLIFNMDDFDCRLPNHLAIFHIDSGNTAQPVLPNVEINMSDSIKTAKKGIYYVHPTATVTAIPAGNSSDLKIKLPVQRGSTLVTTAGEVTGIKLSNTITLPYFYPVAPEVLPSVGTDGTWIVDSSFNNKPISVMSSTNSTSQVRFALESKDALPASKTFKISYSVGLER